MKHALLPLLLIATLEGVVTPGCHQPSPFPEKEEDGHGMAPQAEDELFATYRDPATGDIPAGIRAAEMAYAGGLPRKGDGRIGLRSGPAALLDWRSVGPSNIGGRTRALAIDLTDTLTLLAGAATGGIWKSTDGGENWQLKSDPGINLAVTTIAQDPRPGHTHIWYYGSGEIRGESGWDRGYRSRNYGTGIYRSTDNGESWEVLPNTVPGNPTSWDDAFDFVHRIVVSPTTGSVFVANNATGIYRSTDGGENFALLLGAVAQHLYNDIAVNSEGVLLAVQSSLRIDGTHTTGGIYRSDNDGDSWSTITPGTFPNQHHRSILAIAPSDPEIAYVLTYTGSIFANGREDVRFHKLDLGSGTAEDRSSNLPDFPGTNWAVGPSVITLGNYAMAMAVKPDDPDFVVLGGITLFRSPDGFASPPPVLDLYATLIGGYQDVSGTNFAYKYENHWPDQHAVVFHPSNPGKMWSANDSGIHLTWDVERKPLVWEDRSNGYNVTQFFFAHLPPGAGDDRLLGGAQDNGTIYLRDQGAGYAMGEEICSGDGSYGYLGENYAYSSLQNGRARRQNYLDAEHTQIQSFLTFALAPVAPPPAADPNLMFYIHPFEIDPNDEQIMYFPEGNVLWRNNQLEAANPLNHWSKLNSIAAPAGYQFTTLTASQEPAHVLYLGASHNSLPPKIYRLENAHTSGFGLQEISIPGATGGAYLHDLAIHPFDADEAIAVLSNYNITGLYRTTDGGQNWTPIEGNLLGSGQLPGPSLRSAAILPLTQFGYPATLYLVGTSAGLFSTVELDGMNTVWEQEAYETMGSAIAEMVVARPSDGRVAVGTFGRSMFVGDPLPGIVGNQEVEDKAGDYSLFPNPARDYAFLQAENPVAGLVAIQLYDTVGRLIRSWNAPNEQARLDLGGLAGGVYSCVWQYREGSGQIKQKAKKLLVLGD